MCSWYASRHVWPVPTGQVVPWAYHLAPINERGVGGSQRLTQWLVPHTLRWWTNLLIRGHQPNQQPAVAVTPVVLHWRMNDTWIHSPTKCSWGACGNDRALWATRMVAHWARTVILRRKTCAAFCATRRVAQDAPKTQLEDRRPTKLGFHAAAGATRTTALPVISLYTHSSAIIKVVFEAQRQKTLFFALSSWLHFRSIFHIQTIKYNNFPFCFRHNSYRKSHWKHSKQIWQTYEKS